MRARPGRQREHLPARPEQVQEPALLGQHVAVEIRRGRQEEAVEIADVWLRSRAASVPAVPSPVHSDEEVRGWFREVVLPTKDVWVAALNGTVAALLVLDGDWIDQLYVDPRCTGRGLGTRLVALAKLRQPRGLQLWTFQANRRARSFYERLGFTAMEATGGDNEEGAPDVRYEWRPAEPHRGS
jgi:GNAT superfamily N-acetyltransferase